MSALEKGMRLFLPLLAFLIIVLSFSTRLNSLDDPHMLEFDTVYFHSAAEKIVLEGRLDPVEADRYYPLLYDGGDLHVPTYSIAFLCKINPLCLATFEGTKSAAKWYAPLFMLLTIIALIYLGLAAGDKLFIGALVYTILPGALFRSVAGFSDKDTAAFFFLVLSLYFSYRLLQAKTREESLIQGTFAGISFALASLSLSLYHLYLTPVAAFFALEQFMLPREARRPPLGLAPLVILPVLARAFYGNGASFRALFSSMNLMVLGICAFGFLSYELSRSKYGKFFKKDGNVAATSIGLLLVLGFALLAASGENPGSVVSRLFFQVADPLRASVHGSSVGENQPTSWAWPFEEGWEARNNYWQQLKMAFPISLGIFPILFLKRRKEHILTAVLLAANIYAASRGMRLFPSLAPIVAIAAGQVISFLWEEGRGKFLAIYRISAAALLILAVAQLYPGTAAAAAQIHTSINPEWFENFKWTDLNMREGSPVLAWWDYGYWIQHFSRRPSVADGGNRILKVDQELGLMFTENDESKAASWMWSLNYPAVNLEIFDSQGNYIGETSNEVYAPEFYASFLPEKKLIESTCTENSLLKECPLSFLPFNSSVTPFEKDGEYLLRLSVNYRGLIHKAEATLSLPEGRVLGYKETQGSPEFERKLSLEGDRTVINPKIEAAKDGVIFGYEPVKINSSRVRLMTHDAPMIGKMYWASRIGGRGTQYLEFQYVGDRGTPFGQARIYLSGQYFVALVEQDGKPVPYIGRNGEANVGVIENILTENGPIPVAVNGSVLPGAIILSGNSALFVPPEGIRSVFTNTFLLDAAPSKNFKEVFSNGFAKSFYLAP